MERQPVKSSNIKSIGYDELTKTLEIEFSGSGVYQYKEVSKEVYEGFNKAESIGKYFAMNVKAKGFAYLKIEAQQYCECTQPYVTGIKYLTDGSKIMGCGNCNRIMRPENKNEENSNKS